MSETEQQPTGPDLTQGIAAADLKEGVPLLGHVGDDAVMVVRQGREIFAVGAKCTHYSGPLNEGLVVGDTVRCPWHHACFSLRTGAVVRAPALDPVACWRVERDGDTVTVREKAEGGAAKMQPRPEWPRSVVIVGGGAAGNATAETLRNDGYTGDIAILSADSSVPVDRPNLSKDYLAGTAAEEWIPLRPEDFYREKNIDLRLRTRVEAIDTRSKQVVLSDGSRMPYGALVIATGAEPVRLPIPGNELEHVHYLRTLNDSNALIDRAKNAKTAVVIGASFIGLEVAASLRNRNVAVHVVAPEDVPMARVLGTEAGNYIRKVHEKHGVTFHLGNTADRIERDHVILKNGERIDADLVVVGVGVRPLVSLAEKAGLAMDKGISVNEHLETSVPGIYAAGDVARWPDPHSGKKIRVEHWVVAERQGETVARNILGKRERFDAVPFFWSAHYDVVVNYTGHAEGWDEIRIDGSVESGDCRIDYRQDGKTLAVATIGRDHESLAAERELEASSA